MTIRVAFFDVDGTIVDTEPRNRAAIGGHTIKKSDWNYLAGKGDTVIWDMIAAETPALKDVFNTASSFEQACLNAKKLRIQLVEKSSVGNLKRTWVNNGKQRNWFNRAQAEGEEFLRYATEIKNVWIPYGEGEGGGKAY